MDQKPYECPGCVQKRFSKQPVACHKARRPRTCRQSQRFRSLARMSTDSRWCSYTSSANQFGTGDPCGCRQRGGSSTSAHRPEIITSIFIKLLNQWCICKLSFAHGNARSVDSWFRHVGELHRPQIAVRFVITVLRHGHLGADPHQIKVCVILNYPDNDPLSEDN